MTILKTSAPIAYRPDPVGALPTECHLVFPNGDDKVGRLS